MGEIIEAEKGETEPEGPEAQRGHKREIGPYLNVDISRIEGVICRRESPVARPDCRESFERVWNDPRLHHPVLTRRYDTRLKGSGSVEGVCVWQFWSFLLAPQRRATAARLRKKKKKKTSETTTMGEGMDGHIDCQQRIDAGHISMPCSLMIAGGGVDRHAARASSVRRHAIIEARTRSGGWVKRCKGRVAVGCHVGGAEKHAWVG